MHDILINLDLKKDSPSLLRDDHKLWEQTHTDTCTHTYTPSTTFGQHLLNNLLLLVI